MFKSIIALAMRFFVKYFSIILIVVFAGISNAARPISISNSQTLNFGVAAKPLSGVATIIVNRLGNLGANSTATMIDISSISAGIDRIRGSGGNNSIQIEIEECQENISLGLRIRRFRARYSGTNFVNRAVALDAPGGRGKFLTYGATLIMNNNVSLGALSPCYNVSVNYD